MPVRYRKASGVVPRRLVSRRQRKAAVDSCGLLAETGGKVKEQKTRVQQASVEAALETSSHAGCGGDVATLLSPLGGSNPQGAATMLPAAWHSHPGPGILPGHARPATFVLSGTAGPRNAACASIATGSTT